jgi:arabinan endo-1,5-alpha-L-arabinosidase
MNAFSARGRSPASRWERPRETSRLASVVIIAGLALAGWSAQATLRASRSSTKPIGAATLTYTNPVFQPDLPDPSVVLDKATREWYAFGTTDYWTQRTSSLHILPILRSRDLVHWTFVRNTFSAPGEAPAPGSPTEPAWAGSVFLWAPEVHYIDGQYVMYYTASNTATGGSAIGIATASSPAGPWKGSGGPVVAPRMDSQGGYLSTIDPDEIQGPDGQRYLYYGSFAGGVWAVALEPNGLTTKSGSRPVQVAAGGRYEGTSVVHHDGYYYLFASSGACCVGPNSGYEEVVGRSKSPLGPFVDRLGIPLTEGGGTVVLAANGDAFAGPGGGTVFQDGAGRYWLIFHVIPEQAPYLPSGATARPAALEPIEWGNHGWPAVNHGQGAATRAQPSPQALDRLPAEPVGHDPLLEVPVPGPLLPSYSQNFDEALAPRWHWVREDPTAWSLTSQPGTLTIDTTPGDLYETANNAKNLLLEPAPAGDFIAETKVALDPTENYQQAGLLLYQGDDHYFRLVGESNSGVDETEWAKETDVTSPYPGFSCSGYPANTCPVYGSGFLEPPGFSPAARAVGGDGTWTWLRIVKSQHLVTAYTSIDGRAWSPGATYNLDGFRHAAPLSIGLISVAAGAQTAIPAHFAYVHVYSLGPKTEAAAGTSRGASFPQ